MKNIKVCNVEILVPEGTIGVSCSGGADSVALLYTLMKELPDTEIRVYTAIENLKDFRILAGPAVSTIIGKIQQRIGYRNIQHVISYTNNKDSEFPPEELFKSPYNDLSNGVITALYTGITAAPPMEISRQFDDDPVMLSELERRAPGMNNATQVGKMMFPFVNYDKTKIAEIYQHYNLMDWLYPLTFSCENTDNVFENPVHCGECWWCKERQWAFSRLI